jgi:hypothetical protein
MWRHPAEALLPGDEEAWGVLGQGIRQMVQQYLTGPEPKADRWPNQKASRASRTGAGMTQACPTTTIHSAESAGHRRPTVPLTLRLVLACFGFIFCVGAAIATALARLTVLTVVMVMGAVVAVVDVAVIIRRKHRGEPGWGDRSPI